MSGGKSAARLAASPADTVSSAFHITSPSSGDVFRFVPGVDPRYSTIGLRTAGAPREAAIRGSVDGRVLDGTRWPLVPGRHVVRASGGALQDQIVIEVKEP